MGRQETMIQYIGTALAIILVLGFLLVATNPEGTEYTQSAVWDSDFGNYEYDIDPNHNEIAKSDPNFYHDDGDFTELGIRPISSGPHACDQYLCGGVLDLGNFRYNAKTTSNNFYMEGWFRFQGNSDEQEFSMWFGTEQAFDYWNFGLTSGYSDSNAPMAPPPLTANPGAPTEEGEILAIRYNWNNFRTTTGGAFGEMRRLWDEWGKIGGGTVTSGVSHGSSSHLIFPTNSGANDGWNFFAIEFIAGTDHIEVTLNTYKETIYNDITISEVALVLSTDNSYQWGRSPGITINPGVTWLDDFVLTDFTPSPFSGFGFDINLDGIEDIPGKAPNLLWVDQPNQVKFHYFSNVFKNMVCDPSTTTALCQDFWNVDSGNPDDEFTDFESIYAPSDFANTQLWYEVTFTWTPKEVGTTWLKLRAKEPGFPEVTHTFQNVFVGAPGGSGSLPLITKVIWNHPPFVIDDDLSNGNRISVNDDTPSTFTVEATKGTYDMTEFKMEGCVVTQTRVAVQGQDGTATTTFNCNLKSEDFLTDSTTLTFSIFDESTASSSYFVHVKILLVDIIISPETFGDIIVESDRTFEVIFHIRGYQQSFFPSVTSTSSSIKIERLEGPDTAEDVSDGDEIKTRWKVSGISEGDYKIIITGESATIGARTEEIEGSVFTPRSAVANFFFKYGVIILGIVGLIGLWFVGVRFKETGRELARTAAIIGVIALLVIGVVIAFIPSGIQTTRATIVIIGGAVIGAGFLIRSRTDIEEGSLGNKITLGLIFGIGPLLMVVGIILPFLIKYIWIVISLIVVVAAVYMSRQEGGRNAAGILGIIAVAILVLAVVGIFPGQESFFVVYGEALGAG
jgi:hypothetical protein